MTLQGIARLRPGQAHLRILASAAQRREGATLDSVRGRSSRRAWERSPAPVGWAHVPGSRRTDVLRTVKALRYVTPLRAGGSLPAIVEADDDGLYVVKFRGAGQGPKALIAELVAGEIARALELPVPEIVFAELDSKLGRSEPDFEIQALIKAST